MSLLSLRPARMLVAVLVALGFLLADSGTGASALAHATKPPKSQTFLKYGSRGATVTWVQRRLHVRPASGWYGPKTTRAVKRYQRSHGLKVTGKVNRLTWRSFRVTYARAKARKRSTRSTRSSMPRSVTSLNWRALAMCESSNNPRVVSPAGYMGLYQFDLPTWRSVGGKGYPHQASRREQTYRAQKLYRARGSQPWPVCGRRLYS